MQDYFGEVGVDTVTKILKTYRNPNRDDDMSKIEFPLVTRHLGAIDPESLEAYAAVGGYASLKRALTEMTPEAVLDAVEKSGLRGRGGGGFPTGRKWRLCREAPGEMKYIICNGDEGDPGAFHGPGRHGRRSPRRRGRHDHRGLCHRRQSGLYLRAATNIPWP